MAPQTLPTGSIAIVATDAPSGAALKSGDLVEIVGPFTTETAIEHDPSVAFFVALGILPPVPAGGYLVKKADGSDAADLPHGVGWAVSGSALVADPASTEAVSA